MVGGGRSVGVRGALLQDVLEKLKLLRVICVRYKDPIRTCCSKHSVDLVLSVQINAYASFMNF